jgi:hypothetical protein
VLKERLRSQPERYLTGFGIMELEELRERSFLRMGPQITTIFSQMETFALIFCELNPS